jgi:hypothetical protein
MNIYPGISVHVHTVLLYSFRELLMKFRSEQITIIITFDCIKIALEI